MRFDETTQNLLIYKLRFSPAAVARMEQDHHLVSKVHSLIDQLKQADATKESKILATQRLQKIKQWALSPLQNHQLTLKKERQAYYSFCR